VGAESRPFFLDLAPAVEGAAAEVGCSFGFGFGATAWRTVRISVLTLNFDFWLNMLIVLASRVRGFACGWGGEDAWYRAAVLICTVSIKVAADLAASYRKATEECDRGASYAG